LRRAYRERHPPGDVPFVRLFDLASVVRLYFEIVCSGLCIGKLECRVTFVVVNICEAESPFPIMVHTGSPPDSRRREERARIWIYVLGDYDVETNLLTHDEAWVAGGILYSLDVEIISGRDR
jgi:hypothetical protein